MDGVEKKWQEIEDDEMDKMDHDAYTVGRSLSRRRQSLISVWSQQYFQIMEEIDELGGSV